MFYFTLQVVLIYRPCSVLSSKKIDLILDSVVSGNTSEQTPNVNTGKVNFSPFICASVSKYHSESQGPFFRWKQFKQTYYATKIQGELNLRIYFILPSPLPPPPKNSAARMLVLFCFP